MAATTTTDYQTTAATNANHTNIMNMKPASNDSEESTNMGAPLHAHDSGRITAGSVEGSGSQRQGPMAPLESGHHDPKQRRLYVILLAGSCLSALVGLSLLFVWVYKFRKVTGIGLTDASQLSNLHPILMFTFMVSLNMYAVLVYRTHYAAAKDKLKWAHAILSGANIVMSLLGVFAMFRAHQLAGIPNFYSLHSWIGVLTNGLYLSQFILGFLAFLRPGMALHRRLALMPWHRVLGASILVMAALSAVTGIAELVIFQDQNGAYSKFTPITFVANFAGLSALLMTAITIYLLRAPHYQRPRLPEEEPLKR